MQAREPAAPASDSNSTPPMPWTPPTSLRDSYAADGIVLRFYRADDAEQLFEVIAHSRAALLPWLPWAATQHRTLADSRGAIELFSRSAADVLAPQHNSTLGYILGAFDAASGTLLAGTGFNRMDAATHNAETGYWVRADRRRTGIASRTLRAVLSWGFLPQSEGGFGFRRVHIFAVSANTASCGVPKKLGLHQVLHARRDRWVPGVGWSDTLGWDVLREEWDVAEGRLRQHL